MQEQLDTRAVSSWLKEPDMVLATVHKVLGNKYRKLPCCLLFAVYTVQVV